MRELSEAVSEEDKVMMVTMMVHDLRNEVAARVHMPLKVIAFDANGSMSSVNSKLTYRWDSAFRDSSQTT
jgi:hypothetical protein